MSIEQYAVCSIFSDRVIRMSVCCVYVTRLPYAIRHSPFCPLAAFSALHTFSERKIWGKKTHLQLVLK